MTGRGAKFLQKR